MAQQRQDRRGEVQAATASATGLACFIFRFLRRPRDDGLIILRQYGLIDLGTVAAGHEELRSGHLVANVNDQITFRSGMSHDAGGISGGGVDAMEREVARWPIFILKVNDQNSALRHVEKSFQS